MGKIAKQLQGVLWSKSVDKIDFDKDKVYVVHQVLRYGSLDDISWLMGVYGDEQVKQVFIASPQKIYSKPSFVFARDILLNVDSQKVDEDKYVQ